MKVLWLVCGLIGCSSNHLRVVVKSAACEDERAKPVAGVAVSLQCPNEKPRLIGTTDAQGKLAYERVGRMSAECSVLIDKEGFDSRAYEIGDICIVQTKGSCEALTVTADLLRRARR